MKASDIKALDPIAHIRHAPGMYVGGVGADSHFHIFREIFENSTDEVLGGHCDLITVAMDEDNKGITVTDNGRGIPQEKHDSTGLSTLATVFLKTNTGAKFDKASYGNARGMHGVGSTATNALSELFEAYSYRNKKQAYIKFQFGELSPETPDAIIGKNTSPIEHGTKVHFRPDKNVFKSVSGYDPSLVRETLMDVACLLPGLKIDFISAAGETERFESQMGLVTLLKNKCKGGEHFLVAPFTSTIKFKTDTMDGSSDAEADVCFTWVDGVEDSRIYSYVNLATTPKGGTHAVGLEKGILKALLAHCKDKASASELLSGFRAVIHLRHPRPQFNAQTKPELTNPTISSEVQEAMAPVVQAFLNSNKAWVSEFINAAIQAYEKKQAEKDLKKALKGLKKVRKSSKGIMPSKLFEANCSPSVRELFLLEGDSAKGSCVGARDAGFQEIMALKGKIVNVLKCSLSDALKNSEVTDIINAIGGGVGETFDLKKCRVARVIMLPDADVDGAHISCLLISFFVEYMRPLVEDGRLFLVDSPLFQASLPNSHTRFYAHTMEELKKKAGKLFNKCDISRLKGHGEANSDAVAEYAMKPGTRKLIQIKVSDSSSGTLKAIMADDVTARKKLLGV